MKIDTLFCIIECCVIESRRNILKNKESNIESLVYEFSTYRNVKLDETQVDMLIEVIEKINILLSYNK